VIVTLMKRKFVDQFHWIEENEMLDLVAIAQSAPGAVGYKLAGIPGAIAATIGSVLPSCILVTLIARLYLKYRSLNALWSVLGTLRPAVVAMIASAGVSILMTAFWGEGAAVTLAGILNLAAALISGGA
jgi:chromate transporter